MGSVVLGFDGSPSARAALSVGEGPFKSAILGLDSAQAPAHLGGTRAMSGSRSRKASKMESTV
jgi:hypothetical protein